MIDIRITPVAIIYVETTQHKKGFIIVQVWDKKSIELAVDDGLGADTELHFNLETAKRILEAIDTTINILEHKSRIDKVFPASIVFIDQPIDYDNGGIIFVQILNQKEIQLIEAETDQTIVSLIFEIDVAAKVRDALRAAINIVAGQRLS